MTEYATIAPNYGGDRSVSVDTAISFLLDQTESEDKEVWHISMS